jgi:outer membrane murein-binding lipoprotein Lpp
VDVPTTSSNTDHRSPRRLAGLLAAAALGLTLLAGCGNDDVDCGLDACTVTIDRSVDASVDVLGVQAKFIGADGDRVTLEVAGERVQLTVGQQAADVGGLKVSLDSVTQDTVQVRVAR